MPDGASPEQLELIRLLESQLAERASRSLRDYVRYVPIPGVPVNEGDPDCEEFYPDVVVPAVHHLLMLNTLERVILGELRRVMFFLPPGMAKALALDTPIPTPNGWTTMGELRPGDLVFDERGQPCNVVRVSEIWRDRPVFRVRTDCGDEIIADAEHEWRVRLCGKSAALATVTTENLCRRRSKRPMIVRAKALALPDRSLPIDPYLLGVWLGDGTSSTMAITSSLEDQPWLRSELERRGFVTSSTSVPTLFRVRGVRHLFVARGLINDPHHKTFGRKHVPSEYMRASERQRLELLQGLMDTDGTVCKRQGMAVFCSTNLELALAVRELVRSLGRKAGWSVGRATLNGVDHGPVYRVNFYHAQAARLPRKAALCRDQYRTPNTYVDAEPAGRADTVCITVDSPSHLFLAGRSMTPTHNSSYASVVFPPYFMGKRPGSSVIAISYGDELARKFGRRCRAVAKSPEYAKVFGHGLAADNKAVDDWAISNASQYMCTGALGAVTGHRADGLVLDDLIRGREDADSQTIRDKVWEAYKSDHRTRLKPGGWIFYVGTRWHEDDPAGRILPYDYDGRSGWITARDGEQWFVINLPAKCERTDDPIGREIGEYLWTDYKPLAEWQQEEISQGPRNWSALYQQRPAPESGTYFQREWLRYYEEVPAHLKIYMAADYAVTAQGGDYTVIGVFGIDPNENIYVLDWWRAQTSSDVWVETICDLILKWQPIELIEEKGQIEKGVGPFMAKRQAERKAYCYHKLYSSAADKAQRAQSIRGRMAQGKVYLPMPRAAPEIHIENPCNWVEPLIYEVVRFRGVGDEVDDQVDTLSLMGRRLAELAVPTVPVTEEEAQRKRIELMREVARERPTWDGVVRDSDRRDSRERGRIS